MVTLTISKRRLVLVKKHNLRINALKLSWVIARYILGNYNFNNRKRKFVYSYHQCYDAFQ
jgi:hypothetical protein